MFIADLYNIERAKDEARDEIRMCVRFGDESPAEIIELACRYGIAEWYTEGFKSLVRKGLHTLSFKNFCRIPRVHLFRVLKVEGAIQKYRRQLVSITSQVTHSSTCKDREACSAAYEEGWFMNGGRVMFDPVFPMPSNRIEPLIDSFKFRGMNEECWQLTRKNIPHEPFTREDEMIDEAIAHALPLE